MFSCWAVRPKDRPSFKDMLHYLSSLLNHHDEDEFDATDNRRHAANAFAAGVQDIELGMKETSFSSPGKRLRQATSTEDDRITHPENNDTAGQAVHRMSSSPEYLVMVESPMLQNRRWILGDMCFHWVTMSKPIEMNMTSIGSHPVRTSAWAECNASHSSIHTQDHLT